MSHPPANTASLLTPAGVGAIAVIRIAGAKTADFLQGHFSKVLTTGRCVHGELRDGSRTIDDCVAVLMENGAVDLCVHGGTWVVKAVLDLAQSAGFSRSADSNAGIDAFDPIERDMLAELPNAKTELALRTLLAQPKAWASGPLDAREMLNDHSLWWLLHTPQVAIVGAANVGKSTLANQLFAQERSITADVPGTTRDWVGEIANIDGLAIKLVDTPGIRATNDAIESQAIARSEDVITASDLVILVLDAARPLAGEQQALVERWPNAIRVINQTDRKPAWDLTQRDGIRTIAPRGVGVELLRTRIRAHFGITDPYQIPRPRWWTIRQRDALHHR